MSLIGQVDSAEPLDHPRKADLVRVVVAVPRFRIDERRLEDTGVVVVPQSRDRETREQSERADAQQVVPAHGAQHELFG